jgi:hypothetical protein
MLFGYTLSVEAVNALNAACPGGLMPASLE